MRRPRTRRCWLLSSIAVGCAALLNLTGSERPPAAPAEAPATTRAVSTPSPPEHPAVAKFHQEVRPILYERCYDCHGRGVNKGGIAFDRLGEDDITGDPQLWLKVLRITRAQIMPPPDEENPLTAGERATLEDWIRTAAFGLDPAKPDPGRVTLHRLNRIEYKNTIRDLLGVEFETHSAFPDDDKGYGFDNIADVLNLSPLLMEKYLAAAQTVIDQAVPKVSRTPAVTIADVGDFKYEDGTPTEGKLIPGSGLGPAGIQAIALPYSKEAAISHVFDVRQEGEYRLVLEQNIRGNFAYVTQRAEVTVTVDDRQVSQSDYGWLQNRHFEESHTVRWEPGSHTITLALKPLPSEAMPRGGQDVLFHLKKVRLEGPLDEGRWVRPPNHARFFPRDEIPAGMAERRAYARELLGAFASKAFRRPATAGSIEPLVDIAEKYYMTPGTTFETGVAQAMVAVLASPRFLFRVESPAPAAPGAVVADIDDYSLASRLSYFLWSTMPDEELLQLAAAGQLRANLDSQVKRMLADPRIANFIENFPGQWLQSRLVTTVPLNQREILEREGITVLPGGPGPGAGAGRGAGRGAGPGPGPDPGQAAPIGPPAGPGVVPPAGPPPGGRGGRGGPRPIPINVSDELRVSFKRETEKYFEYILREDRSIDEFLNSDYTFLNETVAAAYKIEGVEGPDWRKVTLAPDDVRGGVLTMGSVLMITSNPTRTSPVKRGNWILEKILDTPTPPPPPDIPALEEAERNISDHVPTMRETMALHREDPMCASCHNRMDPLGLALENFNALGSWRTQEYGQEIDASGQLVSGETFADVRELKRILVDNHKIEFYRSLTEKLLIYALGRGTEYYDVPAVDKIVADLEQNQGAFSALLMGVIKSVPFQQQRLTGSLPYAAHPSPPPTPAAQ